MFILPRCGRNFYNICQFSKKAQKNLAKSSARSKIYKYAMQKMGLEPTRYCYHRHLKPARLPIPPLLLAWNNNYSTRQHLIRQVFFWIYMSKNPYISIWFLFIFFFLFCWLIWNQVVFYISRLGTDEKIKKRKCRNWQTSKTKDLVGNALVWVQVPSSALV